MFFNRKKKPIILRAYHSNKHAVEFWPPAPASKYIPRWWRNLERLPKNYWAIEHKNGWKASHPTRPTMAQCPGFVSLYQEGFILPFHFDFVVTVEDDGFSYSASVGDACEIESKEKFTASVSFHDAEQTAGWIEDTHQNVKVTTGWYFACEEPIRFLLMEPQYLDGWSHEYFQPAGVIDFKYNRIASVHLFVRREDQQIFFKQGTPSWHIIPLTERPVELRVEHKVESEIRKLAPRYYNLGSFAGGYNRAMKKINELRKEKYGR